MNNSPADHEAIAAAAARWVARRDAGLTSSEQGEFERWRSADARHDAAMRHFSTAWSTLDRPLRASAVIGTLRQRIRRRRQFGAATAFAVLCILSVGVWQWRPNHRSAALPRGVPGGLVVAPEKRLLPDGTLVELKGGAEIAVAFTEALRRVTLLKGEAHFQVAKNEAWPFAVDAGGVQVRAVGTAFSVQRGVEKVEVVVTEGRVAVEKRPASTESVASSQTNGMPTAPQTETLAFADAGHRVVFSEQTVEQRAAVIAITADEMAERLAWRAPRVEFSATPLAEAVAMMNRSAASGGQGPELVIDAASAGLAKEPISGMFRADNVGSSRVDLQACKLEYSIVSPK